MPKQKKSKKIAITCAVCRRAGEKLFLKGEKCSGPKCPLIKRKYPPGQHGPTYRGGKLSGYGKQLREKQKVKKMYGILERQFSNYVAEASKKTGDTSKFLVSYLESRLDNVIFRAGFAVSRAYARQLVRHGLITVNGRKVDIPSYRVKVGEMIAIADAAKKKIGFAALPDRLVKAAPPGWLGLNPAEAQVKVLNAPTLETSNFNAKSIIEFYSR